MIDVYQQWAGSCKSVEGNFKRIKLETGETMLKFALVNFHFFSISSMCLLSALSVVYVDPHPDLHNSFCFRTKRERERVKDWIYPYNDVVFSHPLHVYLHLF